MVNQDLMGDAWPAATPAGDPVLYGRARLSPSGSFEARSVQRFTLTCNSGRFGIDDSGSIRVVFRQPPKEVDGTNPVL